MTFSVTTYEVSYNGKECIVKYFTFTKFFIALYFNSNFTLLHFFVLGEGKLLLQAIMMIWDQPSHFSLTRTTLKFDAR